MKKTIFLVSLVVCLCVMLACPVFAASGDAYSIEFGSYWGDIPEGTYYIAFECFGENVTSEPFALKYEKYVGEGAGVCETLIPVRIDGEELFLAVNHYVQSSANPGEYEELLSFAILNGNFVPQYYFEFGELVCVSDSSSVPDFDVSAVTSSITGILGQYFNFKNVVIIVGAALGLCSGLAIGWFAVRWLLRKVSGAFKKGRL